MATAKELHELTLEDLNRRAAELRESLFKDRLKLRTGALESPAKRTEARTTYGTIGVKCWIFKGEVLPQRTRPVA